MRDCVPMSAEALEKRECFETMKEIFTILSKGMLPIRVDFYIDGNDKLYVGEITFFHSAGLQKFHPEEVELIYSIIQSPSALIVLVYQFIKIKIKFI